MLELPEYLNLPQACLPLVLKFKDYRYHLLEGGRGSGKTQSVGRFTLHCGMARPGLRIFCGRELQASIEDSVHTVLADLIRQYDLPFDIMQSKIVHKTNGSQFRFKGFREQGSEAVKGLENVDILWIDEAQAITKPTLDKIIPTIRKDTAKIIFTMNRFVRHDPVYDFCAIASERDEERAQILKVNYYHNPFCPKALKVEAESCRERSEADYRHIWLGEPLSQSEDMLFTFTELDNARGVRFFGDMFCRQSVMAFDIAAGGGDLSVATRIERRSDEHWEMLPQQHWDNSDTMNTVGRIIDMLGKHKPDVACIDVGGLGKPVYDRLLEVGAYPNLIAFNGAIGVKNDYLNVRAQGYYMLKEMLEYQHLKVDSDRVIHEMEKIRYEYMSNGKRKIKPKAELDKSPDFADSLMMSVWCMRSHLPKFIGYSDGQYGGQKIKRRNIRRGKEKYGY